MTLMLGRLEVNPGLRNIAKCMQILTKIVEFYPTLSNIMKKL